MDAATRTAVATAVLAAHEGTTTSGHLRRAGLSDRDLDALRHDGILLRLRRNVLVDGRLWSECPAWERHALRARALALGLPDVRHEPGGLALSHHSSLAHRRLAIYGVDDLAHASRIRHGRGRRGGGLWVHSPVPETSVSLVAGVPCTTACLASLQVAAQYGVEAGLVAADSALRSGACTAEELTAQVDLACLKNGRQAARVVLELADGRRESAGESRTAWVLHTLALPPAIPQVVIRDEQGIVVARSDFQIDGTAVLVEFDGRLKYASHADLVAEKLREDRLRELGYEVVRLTWEDLAHPHRVLAKIRAAMARAQARVAS
ncbi:hypothetical protein [Serinicoccus kebangsaanensis]|uniref:hypothetical protein n=1 Tax=Serinicoccus kebangsaanensis TaxID=2602069 RepID=UPI00124ED795|nr:hypothetical protein [Serinicoccus kebangsaanensis]